MKTAGVSFLEDRLLRAAGNVPLTALFELTYKCPYNCVHCYCKHAPACGKELSTFNCKHILRQLKEAGCLWLVFTGGEALLRPDFAELYSHAKRLGFLVTVFTTAYTLNKRHLELFAKMPPYSIEISVYGASACVYEAVTQKRGSFGRAMANIMALKRLGLNVSIKMPCMTLNYPEFGRVKKWAEKNFGSPKEHIYNFGYDCAIYPRLNGDTAPCKLRISPEQRRAMIGQDADASREYACYLKEDMPEPHAPKTSLYRCNTWRNQLFINPQGRLKFCIFSDKFSCSSKTASLLASFRAMTKKVAQAKVRTDTPCLTCHLRDICCSCPALAQLEMGHEELPVPYFCVQAHETDDAMRAL